MLLSKEQKRDVQHINTSPGRLKEPMIHSIVRLSGNVYLRHLERNTHFAYNVKRKEETPSLNTQTISSQ